MPNRALICLFFLGLGVAFAQGPVILQRGVVNAVTLEPAPSRVAPGDILILQGLNFSSADGAIASDLPLATKLADVQVFFGNRAAPIYSVSPGQLRVQVPVDSPIGLVNLVVQRGEVRSRPAVVRVAQNAVAAMTRKQPRLWRSRNVGWEPAHSLGYRFWIDGSCRCFR